MHTSIGNNDILHTHISGLVNSAYNVESDDPKVIVNKSYVIRKEIASNVLNKFLSDLLQTRSFKNIVSQPYITHYSRVKTEDSLEDKLRRKKQEGKDVSRYYTKDLSDIIGISFIAVDYRVVVKLAKILLARINSSGDLKESGIITIENVPGATNLDANVDKALCNLQVTISKINVKEVIVYINNKQVYDKSTVKKQKNKGVKCDSIANSQDQFLKIISVELCEGACNTFVKKCPVNIITKENAYSAIHVILKLSLEIGSVIDNKFYKISNSNGNKKYFTEYIEVQFRTMAQDIWYHIDRDRYIASGKKSKADSASIQHLGYLTLALDHAILSFFDSKVLDESNDDKNLNVKSRNKKSEKANKKQQN